MRRADVTLMVLATAGGRTFTPVQIQKAIFLLTKEAAEIFDPGTAYGFVPYDYGPFDKDIYHDIDDLKAAGSAEVVQGKLRHFSATPQGVQHGTQLLNTLPPVTKQYVEEVSEWVRKLNFGDLVSAIYKKYPEMKENSVFVGA